MNCGIYIITSPSGNCYVGSSRNISARWWVHKWQLEGNKHHSPILQKACAKYGLKNLKFEKILICAEEDLLFFEQRAIDRLKSGYNILPQAGSNRGFKFSDESRAKMSRAQKGKVISEEARVKMSLAKKGKKQSPEHVAKSALAHTGLKRTQETCDKISAALTGKPLSDEHKRILSESHKGITPSLETRVKLSKAMRGKQNSKGIKHSDTTKKNMSLAQQGKTLSEEHKAKIAASLVGRKHSAESKAKMSAALKGVGKGVPKSAEHVAKVVLANKLSREAKLAKAMK